MPSFRSNLFVHSNISCAWIAFHVSFSAFSVYSCPMAELLWIISFITAITDGALYISFMPVISTTNKISFAVIGSACARSMFTMSTLVALSGLVSALIKSVGSSYVPDVSNVNSSVSYSSTFSLLVSSAYTLSAFSLLFSSAFALSVFSFAGICSIYLGFEIGWFFFVRFYFWCG